MAAVLKRLRIAYDLLYDELPDPRTKSWPLMFKPHEGLVVVAIYVLFVLKWGPRLMQNRPPYNIDKLLIVYNVIQVAASAYVFYEFLVHAWAWDYRWVCEPIDYSDNPKALNVARCVYHYYLTKHLDLLDTVFFVLRKKYNQVSFLHVYHHTNMLIVTWSAVLYFAGGHGTFIGLINSFVHVVMYFYYLLTVVRPETKRSMWWKKKLTQLQITQLAMTCIHLSLLLVVPNCGYPWWVAILLVPSDFFLLCLFLNFYYTSYIKPKEKHCVVQTFAEDDGEIVIANGVSDNNSELRQR